MAVRRPTATTFDNALLMRCIQELSGVELKVFQFMYLQAVIGKEQAAYSSQWLANQVGVHRSSAVTALDALIAKGYIRELPYRTGDTKMYEIAFDEAETRETGGVYSNPTGEIGGVSENPTGGVGKSDTDLIDHPYSDSISPKVTRSTGNISQLTLRQRVMAALNDKGVTRSTLVPYSDMLPRVETTNWTPARNQYQHHQRVLYDLWYILFGAATAPEPAYMAKLIKGYGGYSSGGSHKLALRMLSLANMEGDPSTILMSGSRRAEATTAEVDAPDWSFDPLPSRTEQPALRFE